MAESRKELHGEDSPDVAEVLRKRPVVDGELSGTGWEPRRRAPDLGCSKPDSNWGVRAIFGEQGRPLAGPEQPVVQYDDPQVPRDQEEKLPPRHPQQQGQWHQKSGQDRAHQLPAVGARLSLKIHNAQETA